ncbi:MAG: SH3 domain-containing protein, partial [Candidatus Pacearchaeota archaeon]
MLTSILLFSCKAYVTTENEVLNEIPSTKKLIDIDYEIKWNDQITYENPKIELEFLRKEKYQTQTMITRDEIKDFSNVKTTATFIGLISAIAGLVVGSDTKDDPNTPDDESREGNTQLGWTIALCGLPFWIYAITKPEYKVKKHVLREGEPKVHQELTGNMGIDFTMISKINEVTKRFKTNLERKYTIDLVKDLNIDYCNNIDELQLEITINDFKSHSFTKSLKPDLFLNKYVRVINGITCFRSEPSFKSEAKFALPFGAKAKYLTKIDNWVKVRVNDKDEGYLLASDVEIYYSREKEVSATKTSCHVNRDIIRQKIEEFLYNYYEILNFLGNPLNNKTDKEILIKKCLVDYFKSNEVLIFNDLNINNKKLKYRKINDYLNYIPAAFKEIHFDYEVINTTYDIKSGIAKCYAACDVSGYHFLDGNFKISTKLIFSLKI